jgi:hypothetical protein
MARALARLTLVVALSTLASSQDEDGVRDTLRKLARADAAAFEALIAVGPGGYGEIARASTRAWDKGDVALAARLDAVRLALAERHAELLAPLLAEASVATGDGALASHLLAALPDSARNELVGRWSGLDDAQRRAAVPALATLIEEHTRGLFLALLQDATPELRAAAVQALGRAAWGPSSAGTLEALVRATADADESVAVAACVALDVLVSAPPDPTRLDLAARAWCRALDHDHVRVRGTASALLGAYPEPARRALAERLAHGPTTQALLCTAAHVATVGESFSTRTLEALSSPDELLVIAALDALVAAAVTPAERSALYREHLASAPPLVRDAAVRCVVLDREVVPEVVRPELTRLVRTQRERSGRSDAPFHLALALRRATPDDGEFVAAVLELVRERGETDAMLQALVVVLGGVDERFAPTIAKEVGDSPFSLVFTLLELGDAGQRELVQILERLSGPALAVLGAADTDDPAIRARIVAALADERERRHVLSGLARFSAPLPGMFDGLLADAGALPPDELALVLRAAASRDPESRTLTKVATKLATSSKDDAVRLAAAIALARTAGNDKTLRGVLEAELRHAPGSDLCASVLVSQLFERPGKPNLVLLTKALASDEIRARLLALDATRRIPEVDAELLTALMGHAMSTEPMERFAAVRAASEARGPRAGIAAALGWVAATRPSEHAAIALEALAGMPRSERREADPYLRVIARGVHAPTGRVGWRRPDVTVTVDGTNEPVELPGHPVPALDELVRTRSLRARARALLDE